MWLIGLLVLLLIIWLIWQMFDRDHERVNLTSLAATTGTIAAQAGVTGTDTIAPAGMSTTGSTVPSD